MKIRLARRSDMKAITAIYNEAIETTTATFDTEPWTATEQARWFREHAGRFAGVVAEVDDRTVGWAAISPWSTRCAYRDTAETSTYVKSGRRGAGIGRALKAAIIEEARRRGFMC